LHLHNRSVEIVKGQDTPVDESIRATAAAMTELVFYHLERQPVERVLPALIEKSLERGWRVVVQAASVERIVALDAHLWNY
jgi:hypothetical protein